jgi:hypothetical protein
MAYIYFRLVGAGLRTIEQVPAGLRAEVEALLAGEGQA